LFLFYKALFNILYQMQRKYIILQFPKTHSYIHIRQDNIYRVKLYDYLNTCWYIQHEIVISAYIQLNILIVSLSISWLYYSNCEFFVAIKTSKHSNLSVWSKSFMVKKSSSPWNIHVLYIHIYIYIIIVIKLFYTIINHWNVNI